MVRRLRAADGRRRSERHDVAQLRDPRRPLDRVPPVGVPTLRRDQERGAARARRPQPRVQPGRGVGGERVLDRPVVADRPRRFARHPASGSRATSIPASRSASTSTTGGCSPTACPAWPTPRPRPASDRRSSTCATAAPTRCPATRTSRTSSRSTDDALEGCVKDDDGVYRKPGTAGAWDGDLDDPRRRSRSHRSATARRRSRSTARPKEGFPTPSKKLELFSTTLAEWGWPEYATPKWIPSHVHWEDLDLAGNERILLPDVPHPDADPHPLGATRSGSTRSATATRCGSTPSDAEKLGIEESGLVRVTTRIGHFVIVAWRTEGIRPGVVAASHHMGRWRLEEDKAAIVGRGQGQASPTNPTPTVAPPGSSAVNTATSPTSRATPTPSGSGGTTPACTRTPRSACSPTRSRACSAGTSRCESPRPRRATSTATSSSTRPSPARPTSSGSP